MNVWLLSLSHRCQLNYFHLFRADYRARLARANVTTVARSATLAACTIWDRKGEVTAIYFLKRKSCNMPAIQRLSSQVIKNRKSCRTEDYYGTTF